MHIRFQFFFMAPAVLAAVLAAAPGLAHAAAGDAPNATAPARGLAPAQVAAIRAIGRNVLAAKKSAVDDPADAEQLGKLRAAVESLIASELDAKMQAPITAQGEEAPGLSPTRAAAIELRETARADARVLAGQLRQRAGLMASRAQSGGASETKSAGLQMGSQRAQLFDRAAQKLDAALAANDSERVAQLHALRDQLQAGPGRLVDAPLTHGTPTLQAMPSTSETPIRAVSASEEKPPSAPVKARPRKPQAK